MSFAQRDLGLPLKPARNVSFAKLCLENCLLTHKEKCELLSSGKYSSSTRFMPTRLIEVQIMAGKYQLRVVPGSKCQSGYATLCHCWGTAPVIQSTNSSITNFMQSIPFEILSRTFQDVIQITEALNLRYIWIDSLCIIQDDPADWNQDSAEMARIYNFALLKHLPQLTARWDALLSIQRATSSCRKKMKKAAQATR